MKNFVSVLTVLVVKDIPKKNVLDVQQHAIIEDHFSNSPIKHQNIGEKKQKK